ncbi:hypothetical protein [Amycolatopsis anabasis]|uniref:hypothetical protein n=1 Tax=Amycolatopsis anabasis TaxID=1840409 RepID=UPI00131C797A|nr:hypothetical protein [Amycolatopsis anabasis]
MRLRTAFLALASAFALVCTVSGTAFATEGEFIYRYYNKDGNLAVGGLVDPPSGKCIEIPEVAAFHNAYAFRPRNNTHSSATMFKDSDCEGDAYFTLKPGGKASDRLKLRSVVFS